MKEFRVAHIVSVPQLKDTARNQYHMCLAHLVGNEEYAAFFRERAREGKFVLMDNGAAEGSQLNFEKLFEAYEKIQPTEIVLPDTLYEGGSTIQKSREFLLQMAERGVHYRVMAVPQGRTLEEWSACARIFVQDTRINTIGVSKFLNVATKDAFVRFKALMKLAELIKEYHRTDLEVHLLGCDEGPLVVNMCHTAYPFVRGCDSAFAYIGASKNKCFTVLDCERPIGAIDFIEGEAFPNFTATADQFNELAGVCDNHSDKGWK